MFRRIIVLLRKSLTDYLSSFGRFTHDIVLFSRSSATLTIPVLNDIFLAVYEFIVMALTTSFISINCVTRLAQRLELVIRTSTTYRSPAIGAEG